VLVYMFVWIFGLTNRLLIASGNVSFTAAFLHVFFVPLWGEPYS
jgi:hypothetical protein